MAEELIFTKQDGAGGPGAERAVIAFTRKELEIFKSLRPQGRDQGLIFGVVGVTAWPDLVLAGPVLGAPQAALVMEYLSRQGLRTFLSLGWCGSLQPGLGWGDVVLPESAHSEEGTSAHYPLDAPAGADPDLCRRLAEELRARGHDFTRGRIWTTDAPFRETKEKVREHAASGLLAVEMETSALMSVAAFRGIAYAGLLVVSDEMWGEKWRPGFSSPELTAGLEAAAETILAVLG